MSNLAINDWGTDRAWEEQVALMEFVEDIFSPKPKASILKFERSKHPVGRGEQATGNRYYDNWWWDAKISRKAAQAPSIEEGLAEYEETRSLKGYTEAKPAYADCAEEYRLMQEAENQTNQWQKMERYERFLLNHGYIHFISSADDHVHVPADLMPFDPNDLPQPWLVFLELEEREERENAWFETETWAESVDQDLEIDAENAELSATENMFEGDLFFDTEDGEERIWDDDQRYYTRQECGSLFEDGECHIPPSQELRFDTLGPIAARNLLGFGV